MVEHYLFILLLKSHNFKNYYAEAVVIVKDINLLKKFQSLKTKSTKSINQLFFICHVLKQWLEKMWKNLFYRNFLYRRPLLAWTTQVFIETHERLGLRMSKLSTRRNHIWWNWAVYKPHEESHKGSGILQIFLIK